MAVGVGVDYFGGRYRRLVVGAAVGSSNIAARVAYVKDGAKRPRRKLRLMESSTNRSV